MKRKDFLLLGAVVLLALGAWWFLRAGSAGGEAVVTVDGTEVGRYDLATDQTVTIPSENGGYNILTIQNGTASITDANCGDHTCVRTGAISKTGASIICLPHAVIVTIEGAAERDVDISLN